MDHNSYPDPYIRGILNTVKTIAVVGVSTNTVRPSYFVFKYLRERGYRMIPVNPGQAGKNLLGQKIYGKLTEIPEPIDMVIGFSHFEGGRAATEHLIAVGYRRIGFVGARMDPRSQRRLAGYRAAMEEAKLFDPRLMITTTQPSSVPLGRKLFHDALAKMPAIDAVFCNNDDLALGVLFECHRASIKVPERIGISGFNDLDMMQVAYPSVTSVRTHRYEIGRRAVEMARTKIDGGTVDKPVIDLGFELRIRQSTSRKTR